MEALSWRQLRTCTPKQCDALDYLTNQGEYAAKPLATPMLLIGGGGFGSKSYTARTAAVEILLRLRELGFPNRRVGLFSDNMPNVHQRQSVEIQQEWRDFAVVRGSQTKGQHVEFFGPGWEGVGTIALRGMAEASGAGGRKGAQFDSILFDELTLISYVQFGELMYMRRSGVGLPFCSFMGATNPDGPGHGWVKDLWVAPSEKYPDVPMRQNFSEYPETLKQLKHCFYYIPMLKQDNPGYDDPINRATVDMNMALLEPEVRKARELGDWDIYLGGRFSSYTKGVHQFEWEEFNQFYGFPADDTRLAQQQEAKRVLLNPGYHGFEIWGSFDFGTSPEAASAFYLTAVDQYRNLWTFFEWYKSGMNLFPQAKELGRIIREFRPRGIICDPALDYKKAESEDHKSRIQMFREADPDCRFRPGNNDRIGGWATMEMLLEWEPKVDDLRRPVMVENWAGRMVPAVEVRPRWRIHSSCTNLHRQISTAPRDKIRPDDVSSKFLDDHGIDSVRYLFHTRYNAPVRRTKQPERMSLAWMIAQARAAKGRDAWD